MPRFDRIAREPAFGERCDRVALDERFLALLLTDSPLDRVEGQELRQIVMRALQRLTPDELRVVEQRFQHKRSPGAVASRLQLSRECVKALEQQALAKLRQPLIEYMGS